MKRFATLTVIGKDRSGVIARFTNLLFQQGANIEALEEQVRRGQFSMTLQASWHAGQWNEKTVLPALDALARELRMELTFRALKPHPKPRLALLATKEPHVLEALLSAKLPCEISLIAANHPTLRPLAVKAGIPFVLIPWNQRAEAEQKLNCLLEKHEMDAVVLARFMKILSPAFVWRWKNKIINIHPSLLPAFPGASAYRQAYEKGVRVAGVTAHIVTPDLDDGPILCQEVFRITPSMSLADIVRRGQRLESKALVKAVRLFLQNRFDIHWGKIHDRKG